MSKEKHITIPCKTYVKKYIQKRYGYPLRINNHSLIGIYVYAVIEKKFYDTRNHTFNDSFINKHYNDRLDMVVSNFVFFNIGYDMAPEKALAINRLMEEQLEDHLFMWCDSYTRSGRQIKQAINDFADEYGIDLEIDISFECLKKSNYRLRKKREMLSAAPEVPPAFTLFN